MNGLAVLLCMTTLGVQQTWRTTPEGQLEYVLQVEPTFLGSLEQGESITSDLPASAKEVHRLCLRISAGDLKKAQQWKLELPPLATAEERAAKSEPDTPVAIIVDAEGNSQQSTDVSHGWQAASDGRVKYFVQLAPDLLGKLREGDEIYMSLYPEAGQVQQFVVLSGENVLPRKGAKPHAHATLSAKTAKNNRAVAPAAAENENTTVYGPVAKKEAASTRTGNPRTETAGAESRPFGPRTNEPPRLRNPPRFTLDDDSAAKDQPAEQPLYGRNDEGNGGTAPELITETPAEETVPAEQPLYGPGNFGTRSPSNAEADNSPEFDPSQFDRRQFADSPVNKPRTSSSTIPRTTRASLTPPDEGQELSDVEARHSKSQSHFRSGDGNVATASGVEDRSDLDNNRTASVSNTRGKTGFSAERSEPSRTAPAAEGVPVSFGWWGFVCCALFLSIGGNLYLGWTAAEFYQRYRQVIERNRGSSRDSDED